MSESLTFVFGLLSFALFGCYFLAHHARRKRVLGSLLTLLLVGLSIAALLPMKEKLRLGLDLQGGTSFLIRVLPEGGRELRKETLDQVVEVIRKRIDRFGGGEPMITPQGADRILVQIPGLDSAQISAVREQLQQVAKLEFRLVHPQSDGLVPQIEAGRAAPAGYRIESVSGMRHGELAVEKLLVKQKADLAGNRISKAYPSFDQQGWGIGLQFDGAGAELFGKLTAAHIGDRFAIVLDGKVQSAPRIRNAIYGHASITGDFTEKEARDLAGVLENPLQNPVQVEDERTVSATLGADSIQRGLASGILGLALTFAFVLAYYRFAGLIANLALMINLVLLLGAMAMFGFVLTLPGIAGIILTIGMAVDANVLIYERLREEMSLGKPLAEALKTSYEKASSAIFDSNVTTLITAVILFWKATGPVKGFVIALVIGIAASMFTALLVTRNCFAWLIASGLLKRLSMGNLIKSGSFDFLGKRRIAVTLSAVVICASIAAFVWRGERNFGVDFKGGDLLVMHAENPLSEAAVRDALNEIQLGDSVVQKSRSTNSELLAIRSAPGASERIEQHLKEAFPHAGLRTEQVDKVGRLVGGELSRNSLVALGLGLAGIFVYVAVRFEKSYAIAAIVALLHDVVITVGAFALCGRELSLVIVGAVLTIAGYSINDTIVIFDRIREGLAGGDGGEKLERVMNRSINETLSRTLLTSGITLVPTLALYFLGGAVLHDFAFAIIIGIVAGTYSSIFIASPIVLWWKGNRRSPSSKLPLVEAPGVRDACVSR